jgi:hypothetical protein
MKTLGVVALLLPDPFFHLLGECERLQGIFGGDATVSFRLNCSSNRLESRMVGIASLQGTFMVGWGSGSFVCRVTDGDSIDERLRTL